MRIERIIIKLHKNISLNGILELYNKCIYVSRIFPAYLQSAITNENEENLKKC